MLQILHCLIYVYAELQTIISIKQHVNCLHVKIGEMRNRLGVNVLHYHVCRLSEIALYTTVNVAVKMNNILPTDAPFYNGLFTALV